MCDYPAKSSAKPFISWCSAGSVSDEMCVFTHFIYPAKTEHPQ